MDELHLRTFVAEDLVVRAADDDRILEGFCVPFDVEQEIPQEGLREVFRRGAFANQCRAAHRLGLYDGHNPRGPDTRLGVGRELAEESKGLWASFKLLKTRAQVVADLVEAGHHGLSIGFVDFFPRTLPTGTVERRRVHLDHVALVSQGAYPGAEVTSVREDEAPEIHPDTDFWAQVDGWALTRKGQQVHSSGQG
jgi:HK97 family phage prohead protease